MALNTGTIPGYNVRNITLAAPTTTVVKTGQGILHTITFNKPVATGTIIVYDALTATNPIASITIPASPQPVTLHYDVVFETGLTIVTDTAAQDMTVSYI